MTKALSALVSVVVAAVLAAVASWAIISANTAAPAKNPADAGVVQYGQR